MWEVVIGVLSFAAAMMVLIVGVIAIIAVAEKIITVLVNWAD